MQPRFYFTTHAVARFKERFPKKLQGDVPAMKVLSTEFYTKAVPNKTFLNNSRFMTHLYSRYGCKHEFDFRVSDDVVFVCREQRLVTVYSRRDSMFSKSVGRFQSSKKGR